MDRYWLLTWTTYGTWLAGDERGFVSNVYSDQSDYEVRHNEPGSDHDADMPSLAAHVREHMKAPPFYLNREQAEDLIAQYQETSAICRTP